MIKSLMYHKVKDFDIWKDAFDKFHEFRQTKGEKSYSVGRLHGEPNTAYVINEWDSTGVLQEFVSSNELKEAMKSAGVMEPPQTLILEETDKG